MIAIMFDQKIKINILISPNDPYKFFNKANLLFEQEKRFNDQILLSFC